MKIVLLRSVDNLGQAGEAVEAKRGYFRNFLEPRGMALRANKANMAFVESRRKKLEALVAKEKASAETVREVLDGKQLSFKLRAGDRGQLFGSVNTRDVVEKIKEELNVEVERRRIDMEILKTLGDHPIRVRIYPGVIANMTASVERLVLEGEEVFDDEAVLKASLPPEVADDASDEDEDDVVTLAAAEAAAEGEAEEKE